MKLKAAVILAATGMLSLGFSAETVNLQTTYGDIVVELDSAKAPKTVANFMGYVDSGFYNGTIFHRVMPGFMIQGGGFTPDMTEKPTKAPIVNEAGNSLKNLRGTIAMARTSDPNSATAQFFINLVDNKFLDHTTNTPEGFGYCVFGNVVKGMNVVDSIAKTSTHTVGPYENVPVNPIVIVKATMVKVPAKAVITKKPATKKGKVSKKDTVVK